MNGPLVPNEILTPEIGLVFALVAGLLFGFFLERAGFGSARKLTAMFYFRDFALLRVMFTAVVVGAVGLLLLGAVGRIDLSMLAIPGTYLWPQALGGLLIGLGFVVGGYCPGTAAVGAASGKLDALVFMIGIILGILGFAEIYPVIYDFAWSGGMGHETLPGLFGLPSWVVAMLIAGMALGLFWLAAVAERKFGRQS